MSEYWKSLPRKFCEACKCWFADNKASIEFHERGRRHQENVKRRLDTLRRKGQRDFKAKQKLNQQIQRIEREALKAFKKDIEGNPELVNSCDSKVVSALSTLPTVQLPSTSTFGIIERRKHIPKTTKGKKETQEIPSTVSSLFEPTVLRTWYEAESEEGQKYFWNIESNETSWETPIAFVSLLEQREREAKKRLELSHKYASQANPYGQWTVVQSVKKETDLQLPLPPDDYEEITIEIPAEERTKFREKTLDSLGIDEPSDAVGFKKRKFGSNVKRSVRQRLDNDDDDE